MLVREHLITGSLLGPRNHIAQQFTVTKIIIVPMSISPSQNGWHHSIEEPDDLRTPYTKSSTTVHHIDKASMKTMHPWSRHIRGHRSKRSYCPRWTTMQFWIGVMLSTVIGQHHFSWHVTATTDELLQQKLTSSPSPAMWDLVVPSLSPSSNQTLGTSLLNEDNNRSYGSTISYIIFSSILLLGAMSFLLISYQRCQQHSTEKSKSEWYLEVSLAATDSSNNYNRNEETDSTVQNDPLFSYIEKHHSTSMDITGPDDETNEFEHDDIESRHSIYHQQDFLASLHDHYYSDGPFVQNLSMQLHDYDSDDNECLESDDDYNTSYICDLLQQDDFDDLWNQDDEYDDDFLTTDSGSRIRTGPIDIDSGESVPITDATREQLMHSSNLLRPYGGRKRHRRECKSSSTTTTMNGATMIRKKRPKTVKKLREDYFHDKYRDRVQRFMALQPIPESSENDDNTSVSSAGISYRSKPRTVATGAADDPNDAITESTIPSQIMECYPDTVIV